MTDDERFESWTASRRVQAVPPSFADRVMASLPGDDVGRAWAPPAIRAAVWVAAGLVLAARVGGTLAVLWMG